MHYFKASGEEAFAVLAVTVNLFQGPRFFYGYGYRVLGKLLISAGNVAYMPA